MEAHKIAHWRMHHQQLLRTTFTTPAEVVNWLGAVQAQDYPGAKWSLAMRANCLTETIIDQAFDEGAILRTHVMRPTWHFVMAADIRWMLMLTAPRVHAFNAYMYRKLELDDTVFARSRVVLEKTLEHRHLTRAEIAAALTGVGIRAEGMRLAYILMWAELEAIICSGPRHGKQFTYALIAERAPAAPMLGRDEALAELSLRYYTGHGPATVHDFAWWSGLTVADARAGLEMIGSHLTHKVIEDQTYWFAPTAPPPATAVDAAFLLPTYDELLISFGALDGSRRERRDLLEALKFDSTIVIGGQVVGSWRRTFQRKTAIIELVPFRALSDIQQEAIAAAAERFSAFLAMPVVFV